MAYQLKTDHIKNSKIKEAVQDLHLEFQKLRTPLKNRYWDLHRQIEILKAYREGIKEELHASGQAHYEIRRGDKWMSSRELSPVLREIALRYGLLQEDVVTRYLVVNK
tara:strand:+ start:273 stop:596 length:324 start_codon:yes stop_codon:yes gene_type:complete